MAIQKSNGMAFEYAIIKSLFQAYQQLGLNVSIDTSKYYFKTKKYFDDLDNNTQNIFYNDARQMTSIVFSIEKEMNGSIILKTQNDGVGIKGDSRDIVINVAGEDRFGISAKTNNNSAKASRLSRSDFLNSWTDGYKKCSAKYIGGSKKIFDVLEKIKGSPWSKNKLEIYYEMARLFANEIEENCNDELFVERFCRYILGHYDYYKFIRLKNYNIIQGFNINGKLKCSKLSLPSKITEVILKSSSIFVLFDNGLKIKFRIHNASSKVETSLKFDITIENYPKEMYEYKMDKRQKANKIKGKIIQKERKSKIMCQNDKSVLNYYCGATSTSDDLLINNINITANNGDSLVSNDESRFPIPNDISSIKSKKGGYKSLRRENISGECSKRHPGRREESNFTRGYSLDRENNKYFYPGKPTDNS